MLPIQDKYMSTGDESNCTTLHHLIAENHICGVLLGTLCCHDVVTLLLPAAAWSE
jgi:hypothetical protein